MRTIVRAAALLLLLVAIPVRGQWTALGDMPRPTRQGNALRFENAQAVAVITALSPEVIRVRVTPGREGRDHSYAVINRDFGDAGATFSIEPARSMISTSALRVSIRHAPFRVAFATSAGQSLDEDDPQRGTALTGTAIRVWKRLRDDDAGNGFEYQRGVFARRRFASRREPSSLVIEIGSPDGSYRPQPRPMLLTVRSQADAARVSVGGVPLSRVVDLEKAERGWTGKDGSLIIKLPDRFERVEIRIEDATRP